MSTLKESRKIHLVALCVVLSVAAFSFFGKGQLQKVQAWENAHASRRMARILNEHPAKEACDDIQAKFRLFSSSVTDRFSEELGALWQERNGGEIPRFSRLDLGVAVLRVNPKQAPGKGYDASHWSWEEAYAEIQNIQRDPDNPLNKNRWRDLHTMVRYLLEKDALRIFYRRKFQSPEKSEHVFTPNAWVSRTGPKEFTVKLNPGMFLGHEKPLAKIMEADWSSEGYRLKVDWVSHGEAFRLLTQSSSDRSFVRYDKRIMVIANMAWTKTVSHELGHVLGFADHYYNVWNDRGCYYSQMSRLGDLMSNSEQGAVTSRHWQILDQAYPWKEASRKEPFKYVYGE